MELGQQIIWALCAVLVLAILYWLVKRRRVWNQRYGPLTKLDLVAEAEILLHYKRYSEAIQLLLEAQLRDPRNMHAKLQLLRCYAKLNNRDEFERVARDVYPALIQNKLILWDKIARAGRKMDPDNPLYQPSGNTQQGRS
ncbi:pilus assembly protein FimV [Chitinivorax tropicus]|uniref:Pilus assembly protein FimV n=1 Tax=Chitinivorax tropicus TaxID=714531 RepID=A0A840MPE6_9PROT|nr:tetratricopeptide repeat protein [Chitinivorax tropicus]MBB5017121.1 pilus assembly protein FimV [Chitinivorax tropicus]